MKRFRQDDMVLGGWSEAKGKSGCLRDESNERKDNNNGKDNSRFLRCAPHDKAVRRFGRNDGFGD